MHIRGGSATAVAVLVPGLLAGGIALSQVSRAGAALPAAPVASPTPTPVVSASSGAATSTSPSATPSVSLAPSQMPVPCIVTETQLLEHFPGATARQVGGRTLWYVGDDLVAAPHGGTLKSKACLPS